MLNGLMKSNGWFPTVFDDFFNTDFMPRANSTAPAVNVKESEKAYTMELAAPGIKKEYCRILRAELRAARRCGERPDLCQGRGRHPDHHHAEDRTEGESHQGH